MTKQTNFLFFYLKILLLQALITIQMKDFELDELLQRCGHVVQVPPVFGYIWNLLDIFIDSYITILLYYYYLLMDHLPKYHQQELHA